MRKSSKELTTNHKVSKKSIDDIALKELESYAKELGVRQIGYTKVNPDFIFKDFEILYPNAMELTMDMKREAMKSAPSQAATSEIWRTYYFSTPHFLTTGYQI